ncbi:MAG: hypothetical protein RIQ89_1386 [Bacteroidota bacterium]|jgi:ATP-dependent Clp protease adaptor protein ClpS
MLHQFNPSTEEETLEAEQTASAAENHLVLFNDDVNTFDHVITSLVEICNHDMLQAEQCTLIVHYNGKCAVKNGGFKDLVPMRDALCDRGLSAVIQ